MRASFEIVSRNQPSYRPRITRIESVPPTLKRIAVFGELVRLYNAPPPRHTAASESHRTSPVYQQPPATATAHLFAGSALSDSSPPLPSSPPRTHPWMEAAPGTPHNSEGDLPAALIPPLAENALRSLRDHRRRRAPRIPR
jgi:hypothetical protein